MSLSLNQRPALKRGCRLAASGPEPMLLIPEGVLRLQGPGRTILELCDGRRTLAIVIDELRTSYPAADPAKIEIDVLSFLDGLAAKGAVEFL